MALPTSGQVFFQDDYGIIYEASWTTINGVLDITSTVKQPNVWGEPDAGYLSGRIVWRRGIITVTRTLSLADQPYTVLAEGSLQYVDYFQASFTCRPVPTDHFAYHFDNLIVDDAYGIAAGGGHWADPDLDDDDAPTWDDFEFIDVWAA